MTQSRGMTDVTLTGTWSSVVHDIISCTSNSRQRNCYNCYKISHKTNRQQR